MKLYLPIITTMLFHMTSTAVSVRPMVRAGEELKRDTKKRSADEVAITSDEAATTGTARHVQDYPHKCALAR